MTQDDIIARLEEPFGTYRDIIHGWAEIRGSASALRDERKVLTWRETADRIERIATRLQQTGLERGQSVAILGASSVDYALVFLAAVVAGGVAAPLTTSASAQQLTGMAQDSDARHLFVDRASLNALGDDFLPYLDRIVLDEELDGWMAAEGSQASAADISGDEPFNIIYSSGTTGMPKGIVHSHRMRWFQFAPVAARAYTPDAKALASTPLYSNTTMVCFLSSVLAGACTTIMGKFDAERWLEIVQREGTTHAMLVPVQYRRLMEAENFDDFDLSSLGLKYCTSAPFPADLKAEVLARMPGALIEIYGMTEGGVTCLLYAHEHLDKLHTVGQPAPGHALKVLDDNDHEVPPGTPGNLVGLSPAMMSGYRNRQQATDAALWTDPGDGSTWMRMGDIGRIDDEGFVELVGRAKDMIISGGFNIYPVDLENELLQEDGVTEAAVIGVPSTAWGETPVGFVTLDDDASTNAGAVLAAVNARLGKTQRLSLLHQIAEMPRSHIGKLLKTELRIAAEQRGLPD